MKILKIGGKNLASLAGEFCVDFEQEPLASSGLFAISGPTGAGKTTLLDALCLALYDATPRLARGRGGATVPDVGSETVSAQDARTLLRRGASEAYAEVDFVGNDNLRYRARWSVRRSRGKAGGALQKSTLSLHQLPDLIALGGTKTEVAAEIAGRIGLTFDQFTRAVLLAQNEFSAFLKTDENDRGELLETLTGSAIYSAISRRAFERYKAETQAMQQLNARLADHTPMPAEERCALDAESAAAASALALADATRTALEQQLRWHQEAAKLHDKEVQAGQALEQALGAQAAAQERRNQLAVRELAETARPLQAECTRLDAENATLSAALADAEVQLTRSVAAQETATQAVVIAAAKLTQAEAAHRQAGPDLDQAKALDASSAALAPSHAQALQRREAARAEQQAAVQALEQITAKQRAAMDEQQRDAAWLADNAALDPLAVQWPRWEALLKRAALAAAAEHQLGLDMATAGQTLTSAQRVLEEAQRAVADKAAQLALLETARNHAAATLASIDSDKLRAEREALEARREGVAGAEQHWKALSAATLRQGEVLAEDAALGTAIDAAQASLASAMAQAPAIGAALHQAERSLKAAELACADNVNDLRANLDEGQPCPVCGSEEHPYRQHSGLHDMLAALRTEVSAARSVAQENASTQAAQSALLAGYQIRRTALERELAQQEAALARHRAAWEASPVAAEAPQDAWFAAETEAIRLALRALDEQDRSARAATRARDEAQKALDVAAAANMAARDQLAAAQAGIVKAQAAQAALAEKRAQTAEQTARLLDELDAAFAPGWRSEWSANAERFASARAEQASAWSTRAARHGERATALVALEAACVAARLRVTQAQEAWSVAAAAFDAVDAGMRAQKAARAALFEGRAVADVENALIETVRAARASLEQQQAASHQAAQAEARARAAHAQMAERLAAIGAQQITAATALDQWLAAHPQSASLEHLRALLALDRATLATERSALQAIDAAVATAQAVLSERRQQCELHRQAAPPAEAGDAASLASALAELEATRKQAHETATALRLQVAQDDVRRQIAQSMMAQIERQQQIELRWGRLNELIGSADGKKFRNYAQQFTLDVLLGYANSHLQHLAKRYRLERITSAGGPSLGLLVRDQDMGGEVRSVNSLSGGESFLVSLALALGLASLSSNRVRVESLFIDEGFGSLDSETLRVAMDALDGLQSMGRRVGVISHVQEMTERIATKVLVQPSGGGTSTVTVQ